MPGSPGDVSGVAFVGTDSGRRLARHMGLRSDLELMDHFDLINLYSQTDPSGLWREERRRANAIWKQVVEYVGYTQVVLCGVPVRHAFTHTAPDFSIKRRGAVDVVAIPHPSGLTRAWNDPSVVGQCRELALKLGVLGARV